MSENETRLSNTFLILVLITWSAILAIGLILIFLNMNIAIGALGQSNIVVVLLFNVITIMGDTFVMIILLALLFYLYDKKFAIKMGVLLITSAYLNDFLKDCLRDPRPPTNASALVPGSGYGAPSGHTQGAVVTYGLIAHEFKDVGKKYIVPILLTILISLIAISRVLIGVHDVQDVMLGALIGIPFLVTFILVEPYVSEKISELSLNMKCLLCIIPPVLMFIIALIIFEGVFQVLPSYGDFGMLCGALLGITLGYVLEKEYVDLEKDVSLLRKIIRLIIAGFPAALAYVVLKVLDLAAISSLLDQLISFAVFVGIGFFVIFLAGYIFKKINL
ncbi:MAG: phosphatase PAP2 family protein [Candidatus Helarchaeota archaeon]